VVESETPRSGETSSDGTDALRHTDAREAGVHAARPCACANVLCGPTVYDFAHIGNARPAIVFDVLFRLLRHLYGADHVTYVRNITDVDDKINARAAQDYPGLPLNEAIRAVTEQTERQYHQDVGALGCLRPTIEPRATEHIAAMKTLIERLVAAGHAYVAEEHVLFSVPSMPDYGRLSKRSLDEMVAGSRVEVAPYKRDPMDFVLWKPSKPGEPAWPSPVGITTPGRPGWHIECSAMAWQHLGETFDIHGGGVDLVFPHHENEIAQSRCALHTPVMANYWLHNGFLQSKARRWPRARAISSPSGNCSRIGQRGAASQHAAHALSATAGLDDKRPARNSKTLDEWYALSAVTGRKRIIPDGGENPKLHPPVLDALCDDVNSSDCTEHSDHHTRHREPAGGVSGSLLHPDNPLPARDGGERIPLIQCFRIFLQASYRPVQRLPIVRAQHVETQHLAWPIREQFRMVKKLPALLAIFSPSTCKKPLWSQ